MYRICEAGVSEERRNERESVWVFGEERGGKDERERERGRGKVAAKRKRTHLLMIKANLPNWKKFLATKSKVSKISSSFPRPLHGVKRTTRRVITQSKVIPKSARLKVEVKNCCTQRDERDDKSARASIPRRRGSGRTG